MGRQGIDSRSCLVCDKRPNEPHDPECEARTMKQFESNPKDLIGANKISTSVFPAAGLLHASHAMMNGAKKYNPYNWREKKVRACSYLDACERHLLAWREREEQAEDSGVHHLGHAIACLAILLDAQETGNLVDDRPKNGGATTLLIKSLNQIIREEADATSRGSR